MRVYNPIRFYSSCPASEYLHWCRNCGACFLDDAPHRLCPTCRKKRVRP